MFASSKDKFLANLGELENTLNESLTLSGLLNRCVGSSSYFFWSSTVESIKHVHLFKMILGDEINEPATTKNEDLSKEFYRNALSILKKSVAKKKWVFENSKYARAYFFCLLEVYKRILENEKEVRSIFQKKEVELRSLELLQGFMCGKYQDKFKNFNPFLTLSPMSPILKSIYLKTITENILCPAGEHRRSDRLIRSASRSSGF